MARESRFVILLTEEERQIVEALARAEKLPTSTLARRWLLFEAEKRGITVDENGADNQRVNHWTGG